MHSPEEWIEACESDKLNPYTTAVEQSVLAVEFGDEQEAKRMADMAIEMMQRGYHKAAAGGEDDL